MLERCAALPLLLPVRHGTRDVCGCVQGTRGMNGDAANETGCAPEVRQPPRRKPRWPYWTPRLLAAYLVLGFLAFVIGAVSEWEHARWMAPFTVVWVLVFMGSYCMVVNPFVFPLEYSMFGPYARTQLPTDCPIWTGVSRGSIGSVRIRGSFLSFGAFATGSWRVHPSGIVVEVLWVGAGFVHRDHFVSLTQGRAGRWVLEHTSPEVANPISFYNQDLAAALRSIMPLR
jgi:hypothetical protein